MNTRVNRSTLLSLCAVFALGMTCVSAAEFRWRLSRAEAMRIAKQAAVAHGFKLRQYPDQSIKQSRRSREWLISFEPPSPAPPDHGFLVAVDDATGKAQLFQGGMIAKTSNQAMQLTASKPDDRAWSVGRRKLMLRSMHRGLAAADLESR